jgi:hypothetical protein
MFREFGQIRRREQAMLKRAVLAVVAVFVAWSILGFVIHGLILAGAYEATAELWRPMADMRMGLMYCVSLISAACFVAIYTYFVNPKSLMAGLKYGLIFGVGTGVSMGYGTFSMMPIPYHMAFTWFIGTVVEAAVAGVLVALIVKPTDETA